MTLGGFSGAGGRLLSSFIRWFPAVFTAFFLAVAFTPLPNFLARTLVLGVPPAGRADLIVVLGGGGYRNGALGKTSTERFLQGVLFYREGRAPRVLFSGGTILRPSKKALHTVFGSKGKGMADFVEAAVMMEYSLILGLPEDAVHADTLSTNTYENISGIKEHMEGNGLRSCLIVTSPVHMKRAILVAGKMGLNCAPAPVADYSDYRTSATDRIALMREVLWEYAGLALYWLYGYI